MMFETHSLLELEKCLREHWRFLCSSLQCQIVSHPKWGMCTKAAQRCAACSPFGKQQNLATLITIMPDICWHAGQALLTLVQGTSVDVRTEPPPAVHGAQEDLMRFKKHRSGASHSFGVQAGCLTTCSSRNSTTTPGDKASPTLSKCGRARHDQAS